HGSDTETHILEVYINEDECLCVFVCVQSELWGVCVCVCVFRGMCGVCVCVRRYALCAALPCTAPLRSVWKGSSGLGGCRTSRDPHTKNSSHTILVMAVSLFGAAVVQ